MGIRLIALDLDGTLLTTDKRISQATVAALSDAMHIGGARVVLASARPPRTTLGFHRQLALDTPVICCNGALVQMPETGKVIIHRPIGAKFAMQAVSLARGIYPKVIVSAEILDKWCTTRFNEAYLSSPDSTSRPDVVAPVESWLNRPVTKLLLVGSRAKLTKIGVLLRKELSSELVVAQTEEHLLQVIHKLASKALSLRSVATQLGIGADEVMAIGDNANDAGMLRWAGVGVAMANASPTAMEAADYVTESNDADGVARAVRRAVLDKRTPGRRLRH